jgi:hypothetical protein
LVDAVAFPVVADSPDEVSAHLGRQLARVVSDFPDTVTSLPELARALAAISDRRVRIVLDAAPATRIIAGCVSADVALDHVQLVTVNFGPPDVIVGRADTDELDRYYRRRGLPGADVANLVDLAEGDWSVARALADLAVGM